VKTGKNPVYSI